MELLIKIAIIVLIVLIVLIVITLSLFFLSMQELSLQQLSMQELSLTILHKILEEDSYRDVYPFPHALEVVIQRVYNYALMINFTNENSVGDPLSTEERYCTYMGGYYAIGIVGEIDVPMCYLSYPPEIFWDDLWDYTPKSNATPMELGCDESDGIPLNAPDPYGTTVLLCLK